MRSRRLRGIAAMVVAIGVVVAANVAAYGHDTQADLSAAHRFTLSPETRALVRAVHAWTGPAGCSDDLTALVLKAS